MEKKTGKIVCDIAAILLVLIGIFFLVREFYIKPKQLQKDENVRYTIAIITRFFNPSDGGKVVDYTYAVKNKTYKGYFNAFKQNVQVGDRFFVKFWKHNPENATIILKQPVPDHIQLSPMEGWSQLPF